MSELIFIIFIAVLVFGYVAGVIYYNEKNQDDKW